MKDIIPIVVGYGLFGIGLISAGIRIMKEEPVFALIIIAWGIACIIYTNKYLAKEDKKK